MSRRSGLLLEQCVTRLCWGAAVVAMCANSEVNPNESTLAVGGAVQASALLGYAALIVFEMDQIEVARVVGTIDASVAQSDPHFFGGPSEMVTRGIPVAVKPSAAPASRSQTLAKDLVAELSDINSQIHQIMFQVEKAVARLATSG